MNILIAVPTFENILPEVFKAIYDLDTQGHSVDFEYVRGYDCAKARNVIAEKAKAYDFVLMVDSDTIIPEDTLKHLLEPPADVVLGCYPSKYTEGEAILWALKDNHMGMGFPKRMRYSELGTERIELKGGGLGCALIRSEVFSALPYPYFKYEIFDNGALSEDLYFCRSVVERGMKVLADPRVRCGHMSKQVKYE